MPYFRKSVETNFSKEQIRFFEDKNQFSKRKQMFERLFTSNT